MLHARCKFASFCALIALVFALSVAALAADPPNPAPGKGIGVAEAVRALPDGIKPPARYALVIGVGTFSDPRIPKLPACPRDASEIAKVLTDPAAGMFPKDHVTLLLDEQVTPESVKDALDQLSRLAGPEDLVVVFFSGHGATDDQKRAYWVMSNTKIDKLRATALPETDISELLGAIKTTRLVTLIDACYSEATVNLGQNKALLDLAQIYPHFDGKGRVALTASDGKELSVVITDPQDAGVGFSAFSWHVIQGLRGAADADGDGIVTVDELWDYVKNRTEETSRRQGGAQKPKLKGELGSRFLLAVNEKRLIELAQQRALAEQHTVERIAFVKKLFVDDKITAAQLEEAKKLLQSPAESLTELDQKRRAVYAKIADDKLAPEFLAAVLAAIKPAVPAGPEKPTWKVGDTWTNTVGAKLAYIPAGEFDMGSPATEKDRFVEEALHHVKLTKPFLMATTHVTIAQFGAFITDSGYKTDAEKEGWAYAWTGEKWDKVNGASWRNPGFPQGDDHPVLEVSWNDAVEYCKWLSKKENRHYRLPTEAEFEYACRAGTKTAYPWGDDPDDGKGWGNCWDQSVKEKFPTETNMFNWSDGYVFTSPVAKFRANAFGLYDIIGNALEWCGDYYGPYPPGDAIDPTGPLTGDANSSRVLRGGSWNGDPRHCRAAYRSWHAPGFRDCSIGFRVCLDF